MQRAREDFEERVREVDSFFKILNRMEKPDAAFLTKTSRGRRKTRIDPDGFTMMKASVFLIMYNMVEGAVRSSFDVFYETIRSEGLQLDKLGSELIDIWIEQQFRVPDSHSASRRTYQKVARKLIEEVVKHSVVDLTQEGPHFSGNLDATQIRRVYKKHGVRTAPHHGARGGRGLEIVKEKRNALAHGSESFLECGREYTVKQLEVIKRDTVIFVRSILRNMEKHIERGTYVVGA